MIKKFILFCLILIVNTGFLWSFEKVDQRDIVTIDFGMVERGIEWLEFIKAGKDDLAIKNFFMTKVAPTKGCQAIIHHWERFMKWDEEEFYKFTMAAMDRIPTKEKIKKENGTLTIFSRRRSLWLKALNNTNVLKKDMLELKKINLREKAIRKAKKFLPSGTILEAEFYFVLFGHSPAFSVGKENGYDLLQLKKKKNGTIDLKHLTDLIAHELHHTGFSYLTNRNLADVRNQENIFLLGVLASEGMATYFINQPFKHLEEYKSGEEMIYRMVADDWEKHSAHIKELYQEAENDIRLNLKGKLDQDSIMSRWVSGAVGAAYVLGTNLISVIDTHLGRDKAIEVASDCRHLLLLYNQAAKKAKEKGILCFVFNEELAKKLLRYKGD
jgi:hypothetical protein